MLRVVAGLLAAALVAVLLDWSRPSAGQEAAPRGRARSFSPQPAPGAEAWNLFWALQVSDLHISKFLGPERAPEFEKFCMETIPVIQPALTFVTDTFNIPHLKSVQNYYRKYSAWQKEGSFHYIHSTPFGKYSFICVDATLSPGLKRPYNFFGILNTNKMQELSSLAAESHDSNHTIWFGHYPTSAIISPSPGIRMAMSSATAYLCGHFHTLGGLMPVLHTRHHHGTLELELGDWMHNRKYRILAFDHDLFSFVDVTFEEWPVVLITNPKPFLYSSSSHEPLQRLLHSTHIRILAFSPSPINLVKVSIDGVHLGDAIQVSGPLYVLKWAPQNYSLGFHQIEVTVQDASDRSTTQLHTFAMEENLSLKFGLFASWILLTDHYIWVRIVFVLLIVLQILLLIIVRYRRRPTLKRPWFIGEIIDGHIGVCFSFGVIVDGHFFEGSTTFLVGIMQVMFFNLPLMAYTCWCLFIRCQGHCFSSHLYHVRLCWAVPIHLFMALLFSWQVYSCYFLLKTYGTMAFFLSPVRTWIVALTVFLFYRTWKLQSSMLRTFILEMKNYQSS
ncbi:transmembrane protein 62 isoform X2 [Sceloporus undulatus]|uniref:transmembrane protein 62 isoform X2 n=1 Tax=Sceloporus undulatus TaxID=8520 RepID=UPI001C4AC7B6|nr:transmembrane protein 62 isoform X2 [Sceloporus undulatus]